MACTDAAASGEAQLEAGVAAADVAAARPALRPAVCEREGRRDIVRDLFCGDVAPGVTSLQQLEAALGVSSPVGAKADGSGAVLLAHSTALGGELISELNPRAIVASRTLFVAFSRGLQQVELAAIDRSRNNQFNFYLLEFRQACNRAAQGCVPGDLYTPSIESDWLELKLSDDEDLKNTASDCRQCHQRGAKRPTLLMREFYTPWTHYFGPDQDEPKNFPEPTGSALLRDFLRAKGDEAYANISSSVLRSVNGLTLELLVDEMQPLYFEGSKILSERWPWSDGGYASQPERSATWDEAFVAFKRGEQLALPYFAARATDPGKQAKLAQAYQDYREGRLAAAELPDLADIFPDDPQVRAEIGLQTEPAATLAETLVEACGTCHNDVLDQSISRARFNIALSRMGRRELDLAIKRIRAAPHEAGVMPPHGRRQIAPEKLQELVEYLERTERSADEDALLDRAAQLGMAGGAKRYP